MKHTTLDVLPHCSLLCLSLHNQVGTLTACSSVLLHPVYPIFRFKLPSTLVGPWSLIRLRCHGDRTSSGTLSLGLQAAGSLPVT